LGTENYTSHIRVSCRSTINSTVNTIQLTNSLKLLSFLTVRHNYNFLHISKSRYVVRFAHLTVFLLLNPVFSLLPIASSHSHASDLTCEYCYVSSLYTTIVLTVLLIVELHETLTMTWLTHTNTQYPRM